MKLDFFPAKLSFKTYSFLRTSPVPKSLGSIPRRIHIICIAHLRFLGWTIWMVRFSQTGGIPWYKIVMFPTHLSWRILPRNVFVFVSSCRGSFNSFASLFCRKKRMKTYFAVAAATLHHPSPQFLAALARAHHAPNLLQVVLVTLLRCGSWWLQGILDDQNLLKKWDITVFYGIWYIVPQDLMINVYIYIIIYSVYSVYIYKYIISIIGI